MIHTNVRLSIERAVHNFYQITAMPLLTAKVKRGRVPTTPDQPHPFWRGGAAKKKILRLGDLPVLRFGPVAASARRLFAIECD